MSAGENQFSRLEEPPRFADGKDEGALRTIGEVAEALRLKPHVLRYWEEQFPMLRPLKRAGGRRYYRPSDVLLVETIDQLVHRQGYTLKGAKKALLNRQGAADPELDAVAPAPVDAQPPEPVATPAPVAPSGNVFAQRARLIALRTMLSQALLDS